jgi:hypothetical protein
MLGRPGAWLEWATPHSPDFGFSCFESAKVALQLGRILPPEVMPSTRPKLILDEESFQGLLAAAFTIQQYNEREGGIDAALSAELNATLGATAAAPKNGGAKSSTGTIKTEIEEQTLAEPSGALCQQCGATLPPGGVPCPACDAEIFRPGERLQRTWATMWSISQEQGSLPRSRPLPSAQAPDRPTGADSEGAQEAGCNLVFHDATPDDEGLRILPADVAAAVADAPSPRLKLRVHRADLYLGIAVLVAFVALLWPTASAGRSGLRPWERMLIAMGIAEAPTSSVDVQYSGDPNIKVWVDTQAALYYCPGDELYGKSSGGYYTTQHEAQLDRFEPALRRACVP